MAFNKYTPDGKKKPNSIIDVIKYDDFNRNFVYKHVIEDFNYGTQLIVHESQEAVFFLDGQALDSFGPGRYTLETQNLPFLSKFYKIPTGGEAPFHCEVYFVNKSVQMGIKWGTDSRVNFIEPFTGVPLDIGASGNYNLQVTDARKLLIKLVGTGNILVDDKLNHPGEFLSDPWLPAVRDYFKPYIMTAVKTNIGKAIKDNNINILEIDSHFEELSASLRVAVNEGFEEFGLSSPGFYVTNVALPDMSNPNFRKINELITRQKLDIKSQEIEAQFEEARRQVVLEQQKTAFEEAKIQAEITRMEGYAKADAERAQGFSQKDIIEAEVQKAYAQGIGNMGSGGSGGSGNGGSIIGDVIGASVAMGALSPMMDKVGGAMKNFGVNGVDNQNVWQCSCGAENSGNFCSSCGSSKPTFWTCSCGATNSGKFCTSCGAQKAEAWECPHCGAKGNTGKFCAECGKSPVADNSWTCAQCGKEGITSKFCPECGAKKAEEE